MKPRILLFTGKGGVGKTSVAASTAVTLAEMGYKTLILSTDAAHSLSDALDVSVGSVLRNISDNLYAQEVSVIDSVNTHWEDLKEFLAGLFSFQGLDYISSEELATLPGFDEASELLYVDEYVRSGEYDVIVMDSAPTGESLKLLSFPEAMSWYMEKFFPIGRTTAKIVRPIVKPFTKIPLPSDKVFESMESLYLNLKEVRNHLTDPEMTSIRLVCTPDRMSLNETKRAYTYLLLYGYPVDSLIVNKIFESETGEFFRQWRLSQDSILKEIDHAFSSLTISRINLTRREPTGMKNLAELGKGLYGDLDPSRPLPSETPVQYTKINGKHVVRVRLPFADKKRVNLYNRGGELVIELDNWRRVFFLPQTLSGKKPASAEFNNGYLDIEMS
ncbi:MAG: ArsA family ATPase [Candidatus Thermoplasmatota archaeon]|nr:ArsA family ATPase [Candidatus Thermoplasmatota archaeon]